MCECRERPWMAEAAALTAYTPSLEIKKGAALGSAFLSSLSPCFWLHPVDEDKQPQPHHVHEVPVPGNRLETEVILRAEVASHGAHQNHAQHDGATCHWTAVAGW